MNRSEESGATVPSDHAATSAAGDMSIEGAKKARSVVGMVIGFLLIAIGALTALANAATLALSILDGPIPWSQLPWNFKIWDLLLRLVAIGVGGAWIAAGLVARRGHWLWALVLAAIFWGVAVANPIVNSALRHNVVGDRIEIPPP